ncbi:MAG: hypothetical protein NZ700_10700, partial [Gemmataceae bacterium]|nr:hypothetical protein [Gemmataceae bacterium]MDW8264225.1 hypothetical protein [Gemmataceae bacterium]
ASKKKVPGFYATGADAGGLSRVRVFNPATDTEVYNFIAYPGFMGGVRVAVADVNGDDVADIITAPGSGGGPHIKVYNGVNLSLMYSFFAYAPTFTGGVFVAAGDVNNDGYADIITGPGQGGGPHVLVFSGKDLSVLYSFFAYAPTFGGGVRVAAGDVNDDGHYDIITGAGPGGGPHVRSFSGKDLSQLASFFAYSPLFTGGVFVAAGDINGDGRFDYITGPGMGGGPHVMIRSGANPNVVLASFMAFPPGNTPEPLIGNSVWQSGARVAATDVNDDGVADILVSGAHGQPPRVRIFDGLSLAMIDDFFAYDPTFQGGVFVGGRV